MHRTKAAINAFLASVGYPLLIMSAVGLHLFTTFTAYRLFDTVGWRYVAVAAAFAFPPIAELVVAYYAWRASGSMINGYSVWLLFWVLLLFVVLGLLSICRRIRD